MLSIKHPKMGLELNPSLHGQTPATNRLQISDTIIQRTMTVL